MARRSDWGHTELLPGMNVIVCYSFLKDIHVCIKSGKMRSNYKIDSRDSYARCELMYLQLSTCEITQDTC